MGTTPAAAAVLTGNYIPPPGTDQYLLEFLSCLQIPDSLSSLPAFDYYVSPADNATTWNRQKERTAGEPSCLSFAHHKSFALDPQLNVFDTLLRYVPLIVGFSPRAWQGITDVEIFKKPGKYRVDKMRLIQLMSPAWQVITDVEIFKKPGEYRVDKMRLIQLMSPEFQINNKMIGKRILERAERANAVAADQHGSRKHHKAINTCLNKKLICDVLCQKRRSGAVAMNDAKGCYDRISHPIAGLTLQSFGIPAHVCEVLLSTLQRSTHHIKTTLQSFGIPAHVCEVLLSTLQRSTHHIKTGFGRSGPMYGDETVPLSGIGQGNGLGPTLWALISTIVFRMMQRAGHGIHLFTSLSLQLISLVGFAFEDDTDLFCAGATSTTSGETLAVGFQAALD
eukprot:CAMPEP_0172378478 /NCGR_PEP_ID=MMETSP1060-20121228/69443_1 /TAXON_ID=37318 /ORGANISM="Pseudo-nitzschia pungens, Strain cf. cingulata" /LENGTH=393 /DNA_ID=CAMNT_0013106197 /DNA_START=135 /DNA_END=1317 /DNA_ORIENTATION=+